MSEIDTVGDLLAALEDYDEDTPVRVNDDGRPMQVRVRETDGMIEL